MVFLLLLQETEVKSHVATMRSGFGVCEEERISFSDLDVGNI